MNSNQNAFQHQVEHFEADDETEVPAWLNNLLEDFETGTLEAEGCRGTLAEFHSNQARTPATCAGCLKSSACGTKHENHMDRIERFYSGCFGHKPADGWGTLEPSACRNCTVRNDCDQATKKPHSAVVIAFPAPARGTPTPEPKSAAERETEGTAEPLVCFLFSTQQFASAQAAIKPKSSPEVMAALKAASQAICQPGAKTDFSPTRQIALFAASFELNTRGVMPLLRPVSRARSKSNGTPESNADEALCNAYRLIDLDYLAKHHPHGRGDKFEALLNDDGSLDYESAMEFVTKWGKGEKKAELLQLTPREQAELFIIRDNKTRQRWKRLQENKCKHMALINAALKNGRKGGTGEAHWQLYVLCVLLDWSAKAVADAATRLPSLDMSASTIRRSIPWLWSEDGAGLPKLPDPSEA